MPMFFVKNKDDEINTALLKQPVDIESLRKISRQKGGFANSRNRTRIWPKLLAVNRYTIPDYRSFIDPHRDDSQVRCDVDRSLWNFTHIKHWKEAFREKRRKALSDIIMSILCRNPTLYYYQGYHDVVSIFLLVLEEDHLTFALSEAMSHAYLSDYMTEDFDTVSKSMRILMTIVKLVDKELYAFLKKSKIEPFFATSWLITWFAHDIKNVDEIARIFDALLCSHPMFCFYVCAAYVIYLRDELFKLDCDFATIHNFLVHAPHKIGFPFDVLLGQADELLIMIPINRLKTLCDAELTELIISNKIALISKPYGKNHRKVDSDWTLMKRAKDKGGTLGSTDRASTNSSGGGGGRFPLLRFYLNSMLHTWGFSSGSGGDMSSAGQNDHQSDSNTSKNNDSNSIFTANMLFWSIAVVVGGILSYALLTNPENMVGRGEFIE